MQNPIAKLLSCPTDDNVCAADPVLNLDDGTSVTSRSQSWTQYSVRRETLCKLKVNVAKAANGTRTLQLNFKTENALSHLILIPNSKDFDDGAYVRQLKSGEDTLTIQGLGGKPDMSEEIWLLYQPAQLQKAFFTMHA